MSDHEQGETPDRLFFAEGVGMLIALLDAGTLGRPRVVNRLRQLQHTDDFASLPEDLRERIREIIADAESEETSPPSRRTASRRSSGCYRSRQPRAFARLKVPPFRSLVLSVAPADKEHGPRGKGASARRLARPVVFEAAAAYPGLGRVSGVPPFPRDPSRSRRRTRARRSSGCYRSRRRSPIVRPCSRRADFYCSCSA